MKVYLPIIGEDYEDHNTLGVYLDVADAKQALRDSSRDRDYEGVEVFELNGGRLFDDPDDYVFQF